MEKGIYIIDDGWGVYRDAFAQAQERGLSQTRNVELYCYEFNLDDELSAQMVKLLKEVLKTNPDVVALDNRFSVLPRFSATNDYWFDDFLERKDSKEIKSLLHEISRKGAIFAAFTAHDTQREKFREILQKITAKEIPFIGKENPGELGWLDALRKYCKKK